MQRAEACEIKELGALPESARDLLYVSMGAVDPRGEPIADSRSLGWRKDFYIEA